MVLDIFSIAVTVPKLLHQSMRENSLGPSLQPTPLTRTRLKLLRFYYENHQSLFICKYENKFTNLKMKWTFPLITKILIWTKISSQLERASQN
jgi:hypothetical protein